MSRRNATFWPKVGETGVGEMGVGEQGPILCYYFMFVLVIKLTTDFELQIVLHDLYQKALNVFVGFIAICI